ncbi:hypothetical protein HMPREF1869_00151 [Bacteroidales bacterium KA00251]|nr:hypothetical protein HMPREF1869_00151 [Bacteroidales bacterium KA00251]
MTIAFKPLRNCRLCNRKRQFFICGRLSTTSASQLSSIHTYLFPTENGRN